MLPDGAPPEVMAYLEHGDAVAKSAFAHAIHWRQAHQRGLTKRSLKEYLAAQPDLSGFKPRAAADARRRR